MELGGPAPGVGVRSSVLATCRRQGQHIPRRRCHWGSHWPGQDCTPCPEHPHTHGPSARSPAAQCPWPASRMAGGWTHGGTWGCGACAHLQERAPAELSTGDPPRPGPVDRVEDPLDDLREDGPQRSRSTGRQDPPVASRGHLPGTHARLGQARGLPRAAGRQGVAARPRHTHPGWGVPGSRSPKARGVGLTAGFGLQNSPSTSRNS